MFIEKYKKDIMVLGGPRQAFSFPYSLPQSGHLCGGALSAASCSRFVLYDVSWAPIRSLTMFINRCEKNMKWFGSGAGFLVSLRPDGTQNISESYFAAYFSYGFHIYHFVCSYFPIMFLFKRKQPLPAATPAPRDDRQCRSVFVLQARRTAVDRTLLEP